MKKLIVSCGVALVVIPLAFTLTGCTATFTSPLELNAQKVTLEEASKIMGVTVPVPTYLPEGYEIQEVYVTSEHEVTLLISDEVIEKKLVGKQVVTDVGTVVTPQRYDVKCKMRMIMRWSPEGGVPIKLPVEKVRIDGSWGFLQDRGDHRALWWEWFPEPGKPAMFELVLAASKKISKEELVKVAESVQQ